MFYKKPEFRNYSTSDILEELGPCQNQYTTATLTPSTDDCMYHNPSGDIYILGSSLFPTNPIGVGDNATNLYVRGFFSFDISSIHSTIVSATLRLYQTLSTGAPYDLGNLIVDHVNYGTLEANVTDFNGNDLTRGLASTSDSDNSEWKEFDVKAAVQADIDARNTSQFRVRFNTNTDSDGVADATHLEDIENHGTTGTDKKAQLVVTYY